MSQLSFVKKIDLVKGNIDEIVATQGNAVAAQDNKSNKSNAAALALLNHLAHLALLYQLTQSNDDTVANTADTILSQASG